MSLGTGEHVAYIQTRGGASKLLDIPFASLTYGRALDEMSSASVTVGTGGLADESCCRVLNDLEAFEHEVSIWRDGLEVWVGPVTEPAYTASQVTIPARDLWLWFERRTLPTNRSYTATDLGTIFEQYADDALSGDTSPNITVNVSATGVLGDRQVNATDRRRAADEMREISRTALDFTMLGRELRAGAEEVPTSTLLVLTDDLLLEPSVTKRGLIAASKVFVLGGPDGAGAAYQGSAGGVGADIGLVETVYSENSINDDASAADAAASRLDMLSVPPIYLSGTLAPECPFDFDDLIPGALANCQLRVGCREISQTLRLLSINVDASAGNETISVVLVPAGTMDA